MKFRRFRNRPFLHQVGRKQLGRLLARFTLDLEARQVRIPPPDLDDTAYFNQVSGLVMNPDPLPDNPTETLFAIGEMDDQAADEGAGGEWFLAFHARRRLAALLKDSI